MIIKMWILESYSAFPLFFYTDINVRILGSAFQHVEFKTFENIFTDRERLGWQMLSIYIVKRLQNIVVIGKC